MGGTNKFDDAAPSSRLSISWQTTHTHRAKLNANTIGSCVGCPVQPHNQPALYRGRPVQSHADPYNSGAATKTDSNSAQEGNCHQHNHQQCTTKQHQTKRDMHALVTKVRRFKHDQTSNSVPPTQHQAASSTSRRTMCFACLIHNQHKLQHSKTLERRRESSLERNKEGSSTCLGCTRGRSQALLSNFICPDTAHSCSARNQS